MFWTDLRHGARLLLKERWFTLAAVTALSLGIAANMVVFTIINGALLRAMPFDAPDRIVELRVFHRDRLQQPTSGVSYLDMLDWRRGVRTFAGLGAADERTMNVADEGRPAERFQGAFVSANAFSIVGQRPILGRDFREDDDRAGATPVVILGHTVWQGRYESDPAVIGRTIRVNGVASVVIGVMAEDFGFPVTAELWQPLALLSAEERDNRSGRFLDGFGRLRPGISLEQATADLSGVMGALATQHPDTNRNTEPRVTPLRSGIGGPIRSLFAALLGAVTFVLLIACANVANLLLARAARRSREVSIRMSMGASRWRVVRQLLVESLLLAAVAGVVGVVLSMAGIRLFWASAVNSQPPYWLQFPFDVRVFAYLAAVCLGTSILFGLLPALQTSRTNLVEILSDAGRGATGSLRSRRWSQALIVGQIALTLVLLSGAMAVVQGMVSLSRVEAGVDTAALLRLRLDLPSASYAAPEQRVVLYHRIEERLAADTRFTAALASVVPLSGGRVRDVEVGGRPDATPAGRRATQVIIGTGYFETLGARPIRGRGFAAGDGAADRAAAIVNERFAATFFPGQDPLGQRIRLTGGPTPPGVGGTAPGEWATIVGVAQNIRQRTPEDLGFDPVVYVPYTADAGSSMNLLLRTDGDLAAAAAALRAAVSAIDPDLPLFDVRTVDDLLYFERWGQRVFGSMFGIFAGIALVLAAVGLYAVTSYSVSQRTREFGVRVALGASARHVAWLVARQTSLQVGIGVALGALGAVAVSGVLPSILAASRAGEPLFLAMVVLLVIGVAMAASLVPARRAARVDPIVALRSE